MRSLLFVVPVVLLLVLAACLQTDTADDDADVTAVTEAPTPAEEPDPTATPEPEDDLTATPEPEDDPTPTLEPEAEPTETPEPQETPTPETDDDVDEPAEHVVELQDPDQFVPDELEIAAGDTVTFVNAGNIPHTATLDPDAARDPDNVTLPEGAETWDSGTLEPGEEFSVTLDVPGEYSVICRPHEALGMIGTITVNGDGNGEVDDSNDAESDGSDADEDDEADDYL